MPRFYIHVQNQEFFAHDEDGTDYIDLDAARRGAVKSAGHIVCDEIISGKSAITMTLYIDDERGARVGEFPVTATVGALH